MTIEITDREDFKDKFAHLMAANLNMISAGTEPSRELSSQMIDEFLNQFVIATPAPAPRITAGFYVAYRYNSDIPKEFVGKLFPTMADAQLAVTNFIGKEGYGSTRDFKIKESFYFG